MKISPVQQNKRQLNFKGLIPAKQLQELVRINTRESRNLLNSCLGFNAVYRGAQEVNPDRIARELSDKFHIQCDFGNNPLVASFFALTSNIFHKLGLTQPSNVILRNLNLTHQYNGSLGICSVHPYDTDIYEHLREVFPLRSVIINSGTDWDSIQQTMIKDRKCNHFSTNHFLAPFIHEYMHSAHYDNLSKRLGSGSSAMAKLQKKFKNKDTIYRLQRETGNYGATSPCEMFAEEMTELVVDSLNPKTLRPNELIFKMNRGKESFVMDKLLDACWNGDMKVVEQFRKRRFRLFK